MKNVTVLLIAAVLACAACGGAANSDGAAASTSASEPGAAPSATGGSTPVPSAELSREALDAHDYFVDNAPYWNPSARRCAALKLARTIAPGKLRELAKPGMSAADAETIYQAFVGCHTQNALVLSVQAQVPNLTIDQSKCFNEAGPSIDDSKPFVIALYRSEPSPAVPALVAKKLQEALAKCFTPAQLQALATPAGATTR